MWIMLQEWSDTVAWMYCSSFLKKKKKKVQPSFKLTWAELC